MFKPNIDIQDSIIKFYNEDLIKNVQKTFITSPITASDATITVQNISGAAVGGYIIIGKIGSEKTEIIQIHATTAPSGSTITLAAAGLPQFNHPTDTEIFFVDYNQVEFSRATSSGGTKTVLATSAITPDSEFTYYNDTTNSTGYAYCRAKNSSTTTYSQYSDEQAYANREPNKIGTLIDRILRIAHTTADREDIFDFIKDGILKIVESREKWSFEEAERDVTNSYAIATEEFTIPSDIKEYKSQYIEWIGPEGGDALKYIDIREFENKISGLPRTTLNGAVLEAATSIILTDSTNFSESGTGYIGTDEFTWTAKDSDTHTLSGVSGILAHDSGSLVLGESAVGTPEYWTMYNNVGRLFSAPSDSESGKRLVIEYYKKLDDIDSENDTIPTAFWGMLIDFALMRLAQRNREFTEADRYNESFMRALQGRIAREKINAVKQLQCE